MKKRLLIIFVLVLVVGIFAGGGVGADTLCEDAYAAGYLVQTTADDPDVCNKIGGGWPLKTRLCRIYKAKVY